MRRLIDANKVAQDVRENNRKNFKNPDWTSEDICTLLENAPTVDAVEVVHGEWIVCGDGDYVPFMCSACGKTTAYTYKVMYGNYCPNCGAKMDLEAT